MFAVKFMNNTQPGYKCKNFNLDIFHLNENFCKLSTFRESRVFAKPVPSEFYLLLLLFLGSAGDQG
jgi:hypothetical protein